MADPFTACAESDDGAFIFRRDLWPSADDALEAAVEWLGDSWLRDELRVQLVWAFAVPDHPEGPGWHEWRQSRALAFGDPDRPVRESVVECWEVS